mmetsp:Transcript_23206/g.34055  ORF Transcript_23206/g.34055 Transcript_23206/m.34055 type:complete len:241 (-) Transcript_23206:54-776(-)
MSYSDSSDDEVEYEEEVFQIREFEFRITTVSYMPIAKLMRNREKSVEISGQKLWCGSLAVMEYLLDHRDFIRDCNILELGAGTGVVGMLCQRLGSGQVYLTDNDVRSIAHMTQDIQTNSVDATVVPLDWFNFDVSVLDREIPTLFQKQVRLLAGDVLYKHDLIRPFFSVVSQVLSRPGTKMILCHVPRAGVDQSNVITAAESHGLKICALDREQWCKGVCIEYSVSEDYERAMVYEIYKD